VIHFLDESGHQKPCNLLTDGPTLLLNKVVQTLLHQLGVWPDLQGMSATSLDMPGISKGFHAKMSLLAWKKSTSALCYLEESVVPIHILLSLELSGSMRITLTPSAGSKDSVLHLESGASSAVSSWMTASSSEVMIAEAII
jgi:hypothetical protein